jgi:sigma-E factor negative regulatory protein RseA
MVNRSEPSPAARQALSSLMDGESSPADAADALAAWRHEADARVSWHAYHLIGDVLRSEDLACPPLRDEAFLQSLRARLADEPVPLAPTPLRVQDAPAETPVRQIGNGAPLRSPGRRLGRLMAPAAVAAGFVAVAGVMVATRSVTSEPTAGPALASTFVGGRAIAGATPASSMLVRDARLDRYLSAHRSLASGVAATGRAEQRVQIVFEGQ